MHIYTKMYLTSLSYSIMFNCIQTIALRVTKLLYYLKIKGDFIALYFFVHLQFHFLTFSCCKLGSKIRMNCVIMPETNVLCAVDFIGN